MSLDKRSVPVDLVGGLAKGEDDFASEGLAKLRNARFRLGKQIGKRNGALTQESSGLPTQANADRNCIVDLDGVPSLVTNDGSYRRNVYDGTWDEMGATAPRPSRIVTSPLVRTNDSLLGPDCSVIGNVLCAVWQDLETSQGFYAFWDVAEDTPRLLSGPTRFVGDGQVAAIIDHIRVVAVGASANAPTRFVVVGRTGTGVTADLAQCSYQLSAGTWTFSVPTLIVVNATAFNTVERDATAVAYYVAASAGGTARLRKYTYASVLVNSLAMTTAANLPIALVHNAAKSKLFGIGALGNVTHCADDCSGVDTTIAAMGAPASGAPFTFTRAAISLADSSGAMWVARSSVGPYSVGSPCCTQMAYLDSTFAVLHTQVVAQYVLIGQALWTGLTGAVFCVGDQYATMTTTPAVGTIAIKQAPVGHYIRPKLTSVDTGESPIYTIRAIECGRFCQDTLYGFDLSAHLPRIANNIASQSLGEPQPWYQCMSTGASDVASFTGRKIDLIGSRHYYADPARNVTAQGLRVLANGVGTTVLDGMTITENTPPCPGYLTSDGYDTGITQASPIYFPSDTTTSVRLILVWRWIDAKGNVHRGAPSSPYDIAIASVVNGGGNNPLKVVFPKHAPTGLDGSQYLVPEVEVYMFPVGFAGAEYRLVGIVPPEDDASEEGRVYIALMNNSVSAPVASLIRYRVDVTEGNWSTDSVSGGARPGLYTDTGELPSWPSPPLLDVVSTQSRLWGLSAEGARLDVWYTKPMVEGRAPEWSDTLRVLIPQEGGDCVALAALDDKVVALKRRQIFVISGDPGDSSGNGSSMQRPRLVSGDVGCVNVNSVVEGPFGVAFQSERGWYALSRGLELSFIGAPMIAAFDADWAISDVPLPYVECSTLVPSESEVRWVVAQDPAHGDDLCAVWNYLLNKWSVSTSIDARSFAVVDGVSWRLGRVSIRVETPDVWDALTGTTQQIDSPWLKLNGLAGFQRLWRIVLTFRWYSGSIAVQTSTDYKTATETPKSWSAATLATLVDATTRLVQLDVRPTVQRCEALRIGIASVDLDQERGFELVGCQLEIGTKRGAFKKLAAAAKG